MFSIELDLNIRNWLENGFSSHDAYRWTVRGFSLNEAINWKNKGFSIVEAQYFRLECKSPEEALIMTELMEDEAEEEEEE